MAARRRTPQERLEGRNAWPGCARTQPYQHLRDGCKEAIRSLQTTQELIAELNNHHRRLDQEITEIGKELEGAPVKEVANWERQRQELVRKLSEADNRHGAIQLAVRSYQAKIDKLQAEFDRTAVRTRRLPR